MHLFQSEWLREPARPVAGSYARPAYAMRYARRADHAIGWSAIVAPSRPEVSMSDAPPTPDALRFARAA